MNWNIVGDIHGNIKELDKFKNLDDIENCAIIVLGDFGANFDQNWHDRYFKEKVQALGCKFFAVKGNHEMRPQTLKTMKKIWSDDVNGYVYTEDDYSNIFYFMDYGIYNINDYKCGVIGGAYSVDKIWRLENGQTWFSDEQLTSDEMKACEELFMAEKFDFIFSHTCPINYRPTDMFLSFINQSTVDNTVELWMQRMIDNGLKYGIWLWGHYHGDRIEAPHMEMYYNKIDSLDNISERWKMYDTTHKINWWFHKSPYFYMHEEALYGKEK